MCRRSILLALVLALAATSIVVTARPTQAATDHISGTLTSGDPTMKLIQPNLNTCGSVLAVDVHYDAVEFDAPVSGTFEFLVTVGGENTAMYLFHGAADPANPLSNCIRASNGTPPQFHALLEADQPYTLVIVDATESQTGGAWTVQATYPDGGLGGTPPTPPDPTPGGTPSGTPSDGTSPAVVTPTFTG